MKIQDIQYILEKFEVQDFAYEGSAYTTVRVITPIGIIDLSDLSTSENEAMYNLFLQRTIEAINKSGEWVIDQYSNCISMNRSNSLECNEVNIEGKDTRLTPDQAKEQAILYIINKLRSEG